MDLGKEVEQGEYENLVDYRGSKVAKGIRVLEHKNGINGPKQHNRLSFWPKAEALRRS